MPTRNQPKDVTGPSPNSSDEAQTPHEEYVTPKLIDLGDVRDITLGNSIGTPDISGGALDEGQPANP